MSCLRDDDESDGSGENRISRHRRIHEPEVLSDEEEDNDVNMERCVSENICI